mmetsp:Transcript_62790/g.147333  ORF Transcript_62790/g.147333 Transcript_62790/m.147333 type:complete len:88 (-) Transcript_62790:3273-3536(-)
MGGLPKLERLWCRLSTCGALPTVAVGDGPGEEGLRLPLGDMARLREREAALTALPATVAEESSAAAAPKAIRRESGASARAAQSSFR